MIIADKYAKTKRIRYDKLTFYCKDNTLKIAFIHRGEVIATTDFTVQEEHGFTIDEVGVLTNEMG